MPPRRANQMPMRDALKRLDEVEEDLGIGGASTDRELSTCSLLPCSNFDQLPPHSAPIMTPLSTIGVGTKATGQPQSDNNSNTTTDKTPQSVDRADLSGGMPLVPTPVTPPPNMPTTRSYPLYRLCEYGSIPVMAKNRSDTGSPKTHLLLGNWSKWPQNRVGGYFRMFLSV